MDYSKTHAAIPSSINGIGWEKHATCQCGGRMSMIAAYVNPESHEEMPMMACEYDDEP